SGRRAKTALLADCLRAAEAVALPIVAGWLAGQPRQRRTGIGWASLREMPPPAEHATLTVLEVDASLDEAAAMAGSGAVQARREVLLRVLARAIAPEQRLLAGLLTGELRQGAQAGVLLEAVALAGGVPADAVRRAVTLSGDLPAVTAAALAGPEGLGAFRLTVGRPLAPMLAQSAPDLGAALERTGAAAVEWKLDGVRVQIHRDGDDVAVFTRTLDDITDRVPEVVVAARSLRARAAVLDGEVIALRPDGRPRPFQVTASRAARRDVAQASAQIPLTTVLFDALHVDGADVLDDGGARRRTILEQAAAPELLVPRHVVAGEAGVGDAEVFAAGALARGHEGVVVKALDSPYAMGRRGAGWVKVKPRITLDLVVLAAEWGHGRRSGWLSNLHLGARDPAGAFGPPGGFVMLGKTFKGLTDAMLAWQTEYLQTLATRSTRWVVEVRPELVVEIAFDGVQSSPRYPAGLALRFARVLAHRPDKSAADADTIDTVRRYHVAEDVVADG
ncbi:MAG: ATP-dependent DNA ligase, partial [Kineosporiaceae bacterium]